MSKPRILAVDDEKALCHLLALNLEDAGYDVTEATSGNQALELLSQQHFDLVISDIRMPDGDGIFLLNEMKKLYPHTPPFFFISAFSDFTDAEVYHLGSENLLRKPVDYDVLTHCVAESLKSREIRWHSESISQKPDYHINIVAEAYTLARNHGLLNVGNGGIFLHTAEALPRIGQIVHFDIIFSDGQDSPLRGNGICRWVRENARGNHPRGFGIEFQAIDHQSQKYFNHLWERYPSISYIPIS